MPSSFMLAILTAASNGRFPTTLTLGSAEPFSILASFLMSAVVGGIPTVTVKFFLASPSILTGTCIPLNVAVFLLISSTTAFTVIPSGPSDGPRGGPAVAFPPGTKTSTTSAIVFAPCRPVVAGSKLGSVYFDVKGNKGDLGLRGITRYTSLHLIS